MDRADEILVEVRGLRSVLDALLTALTANEEEGGDPDGHGVDDGSKHGIGYPFRVMKKA